MKKLLSILFALALLGAMVIPAYATSLPVVFTSDSQAVPGYYLTVDKGAMLELGSNTADTYNAMLEGNVIYCWYKNGLLHSSGTGYDSHKYLVKAEDAGSTLKLVIEYYSSNSFTTQVGTATSETFTVRSAPLPVITTTSLPNATVGKAYYVRLACTDSDATFSEFMGSQLSEFGLYLTQHGEIEGTPTKAGNCHVNIGVVGEGGDNYFSFDMTVSNAAPLEITTTSLPKATVGTAYSTKISCNDPDAEIGLYYNPGKANDFDKTGLTLSKNGTISGTPKTAGTYTFCVSAVGAGGEDYREYTLTVEEKTEDPTEASDPAQKEPATKIPNQKTETTQDEKQQKDDDQEENPLRWLILVGIGVVAAGAGIGLAVILTKKKS